MARGDDDKYTRLVEAQLAKLDGVPAPTRLQQAPKAKLSTLVKAVGRQKATQATRLQLQGAFDRAGIATVPSLDDPELDLGEWVRFFKKGDHSGFVGGEYLFDTEDQLQRYIRNNPGSITGFGKLKLEGEEHRLATGQRIDLVFRGKGGAHVLVELKAGAPDTGLPGQMRHYLEAYEAELRARGDDSEVKGLIVTGQPDHALVEDVRLLCADWEVRWLLYRRRFSTDRLI